MSESSVSAQFEPLRIGVLISGSGTNLQAIIDEIDAGHLPVRIKIVISSRPDAYGLTRAKDAGIQTFALNKTLYADPHAANELIAEKLTEAHVDYVIMAGYMRMLGTEVLDAFPNRVVNLHPALLPSFKGAHAIKDAYEAGVKVTGVTVHFANAEYDKGPIIAQRPVTVHEDDTLDTLEARIHETEYQIYPEVLRWLSAGAVQIKPDGRVAVHA